MYQVCEEVVKAAAVPLQKKASLAAVVFQDVTTITGTSLVLVYTGPLSLSQMKYYGLVGSGVCVVS